MVKTVLKSKKNYLKWGLVSFLLAFLAVYTVNDYYRAYQLKKSYAEAQKAFYILAVNYKKATEKITYLDLFENPKQRVYVKTTLTHDKNTN